MHRARRHRSAYAATLGLAARLERFFARSPGPSAQEISDASLGACHGGQQRAEQCLLDRGADINWIPAWERLTPLDAAARRGNPAGVRWLHTHGAAPANLPSGD